MFLLKILASPLIHIHHQWYKIKGESFGIMAYDQQDRYYAYILEASTILTPSYPRHAAVVHPAHI